MQEITFISRGLNLKASIFYPTEILEKNPAILFIHGWTSERKRSYQYAESLSDLGYFCFLFDLGGHGESEGDLDKYTNKEFLDDALNTYDYLDGIENVDSGKISAVGSSFGGYLVALLSEKRKLKNLVLRAPADYPNEGFNNIKKSLGGDDPDIMNWRSKKKNFKETFALNAIHNFTGNVLLLESENDDRIPHQTIENYAQAIKDKKKLKHIILKGAPHSIRKGKYRDGVEKIMVEWFKDKN